MIKLFCCSFYMELIDIAHNYRKCGFWYSLNNILSMIDLVFLVTIVEWIMNGTRRLDVVVCFKKKMLFKFKRVFEAIFNTFSYYFFCLKALALTIKGNLFRIKKRRKIWRRTILASQAQNLYNIHIPILNPHNLGSFC